MKAEDKHRKEIIMKLCDIRDRCEYEEDYEMIQHILDNFHAYVDIVAQQIVSAADMGIRNAEFFGDLIGRWDD